MIRDHPWVGVGPGAFPVALTHYQQIPYTSGENPHNLYLEIAAEYGLAVAILAGLALLICLVRAAMAGHRLPLAHAARTRRMVLVAALAAFAVHNGMDLDWSFPAIALTSVVLLGLTVAGSRHPSTERPRRRMSPIRTGAVLLALAIVAGVAAARYGSAVLVTQGRTELAAGHVADAEKNLVRARWLNPLSFSAHYWLRVDPAPRRRPPGGARGRRADALERPAGSQRPRPRGRDGAGRRPLGGGNDRVPARRGTGAGSPPVVSRRPGRGVGVSRKIRGEHTRVRARRVPVHSGTGPDQRGPLPGPRRSVPFGSHESYRSAPVRTGRRSGRSAGRHRPRSPARTAGCPRDLRHHGSPRADVARGRHRELLARLDRGGLVSGGNLSAASHPPPGLGNGVPTGPPGLDSLAPRWRSVRRPCVTRSRSGKADARTIRCARTVTRFTREGWLLSESPSLEPGSCKP